jgi:hypothetical protein
MGIPENQESAAYPVEPEPAYRIAGRTAASGAASGHAFCHVKTGKAVAVAADA